jgi:hypothetical protein
MRWLVVVVLGACSFHNNDLGAHDGAVEIDAPRDGHVDPPIDGAPDAPPDASNCFGGGLATVCLTQLPTGDHDFPTDQSISTDTDCTQVVHQNGGPELCVIAGVNIHIGIDATLDATGSRPLVLVATNTLEVSGKIDVSSYRLVSGNTVIGEHVGAGEASAALCGTTSAGGNDGTGGAGGGAGGTFGGRGGAGAAGRNGGGGTAGASAPVGAAPTFVRGGCAGTAGGSTSRQGGGPGHGGGAVYLIAGSQIMMSGVITASGQGGYGGDLGSGGGGAGAGGLIGIDAPAITSSATIFANGGAGGEGGGQSGYGFNGDSAVTATTAATCYDFNSNGGNGGTGSVGTTLDGSAGQTNDNGGGGGGGAAGVIRVFGTANLGGTVSPPAT